MAYGDTDSTIDPGSVYLSDIPGWEESDPHRPTAADQGLMDMHGMRHFLHNLELLVENEFTGHKQQNDIMDAIRRSLKPDPNIVPTRSVAADSWDTGQWAAQTANNAARLVGSRTERRAITVVNNGSATVYLDKSAVVNQGESFPLAAGASITLAIKSEIWAASATVGATLAFFETYDND